MNKKLYRVLTVLLVLVLAVGVVMMGRDWLDGRAGEEASRQAMETAGLTPARQRPAREDPEEPPLGASEEEPPDPLEELAAVDLEALRAVNPDVVGWLAIPDTGISYPMVQGEDNQYYLRRTWQGESNTAGSIFLESANDPALTDFNTIVYGHRMRSGTMFAPLQYYSDPDYLRAHPSVYITDGGGLHRYDVFAAHSVGVEEIVYRLDLETEERQEEFLSYCMEHSEIGTDVEPKVGDRILTLSTCTGNGYAKRWVVQAVLAEDPQG